MHSESVASDTTDRFTQIGNSLNIENVVVSSAVGQELDLQLLALDLEGARYDPENFPGLVYRTEEPRATNLIFRSGKLVCTGSDAVEKAQASVDEVVARLDELEVEVVPDEVTVQNVVASGDVGAHVNLNAVAIGLGLEHVEYEPEQFPGLVYRMDDPAAVVLLFGSGKTVVTGTKDPEGSRTALVTVARRLDELGLLN
jgi:transcription initiation factor TFIID TATA-box-binding protein